MKSLGENSNSTREPRRRSLATICVAAPSLIALVAGGLITVVLLAHPTSDAGDWYVARSEQALEAGDYQTAVVGYARLLQRHPTDPRAAAGLEASLRGLGRNEEAETIHRRFAEPVESAAHQPAR